MPQRTQKIRNATRRLPAIEQWRKANLCLDLDRLKTYQYDYVKFRVSPWTISIADSEIPQPTGQVRQCIIEGLLDIYDQWKKQLDKIDEHHYLKIWLLDPDIRQSQVVCGIGGKIAHYEQVFCEVNEMKLFHPENYGFVGSRLATYEWEACMDKDPISTNSIVWVGK